MSYNRISVSNGLERAKVVANSFAAVAVGASAGGLAITLDDATTHVLGQVETAAIRLCWDGTTAEAAVGFLLIPGDWVYLTREQVKHSSAIRATTTSGQLNVTQMRDL